MATVLLQGTNHFTTGTTPDSDAICCRSTNAGYWRLHKGGHVMLTMGPGMGPSQALLCMTCSGWLQILPQRWSLWFRQHSSCHLLSLTLCTVCMPVSFCMISKVERLSSKPFELEYIASIFMKQWFVCMCAFTTR